MAEIAPWLAEKESAITIKPVGSENPNLAPWLTEEQPGLIEDAAKTVAPSLLRGTLAGITMPRTVSDLTGQGVNWAVNKLAPDSKIADLANKFHAADTGIGGAFPSYEQLKSETERDITGPLYDAKRPLGKGVQTAAEVLPSVLGGGVLPALGRAAGAGIASGGLGETVKALKENLIPSIPDWAEPVARGLGAIGGAAGARRAVTPFPAKPEHAAIVAAVKAKDPNFPMSAGQETGSAGLMGLEGRSSKMASLPEKQTEAFTRGTMKEMGVDGLATPENIAQGKVIGENIRNIRAASEINPTEFPGLNTEIGGIVRKHAGVVGKDNAKMISDLQKEIKLGASNSPAVASMPGKRYEYMRQRVQSAIDGSSTGTEKTALSEVRAALDDAFHRSIPKAQSAELKELEKQYANYKVISNKAPGDPGVDLVTPKEMHAAVAKDWGNAAVNETSKSTLAPWARNVAKVTKELPKPEAAHGPSGLGFLIGMLSGAGAGAATGGIQHAVSEGLVGALAGTHANDIVRSLKETGARLATTSPAQTYFRNQGWLPNGSSPSDKETLARLLLTPPAKQLLPDHTK